MTNAKYLITGATGATGGAAVAALRAAGGDVRALVHREDERSERLHAGGAEVVLGDLGATHSVRAALEGVQGAYFCYPIAPGLVEATARFAQAARGAGVGVVVNMSQVIAREDAASHAAFTHWLSERVFDWSGVPAVHLRPTFFAEWLLYMAPMVRQGTVYAPYGAGRAALIAAEDQGRVIAAILQDPAPHVGRTYPLYGPVEHTFPELAAVVSGALGREVAYRQVPFEVMRDAFAPQGPAARNDSFTGYAESNRPDCAGETYLSQHLRQAASDFDNGLFAGINDVVARLTGRPPLTIEEFVEKNRAALV